MPPRSKPPRRPAASSSNVQGAVAFEEPDLEVVEGIVSSPIKGIVYGAGGVGKTTLCSLLKRFGLSVRFVDVELSSKFVDASRVTPRSWEEVRGYLRGQKILDSDVIVVDSLTRCVNLCSDFVVRTVPHEKPDRKIQRLEDYGWGKGAFHLHDCFLPILADLDALVEKGKHVICTAHECVSVVPNPESDDYIRFEPRLPSGTKKGEANIRAQVCEWADHLFFVQMDKDVKDGKAKGEGTRSIYPYNTPQFWAKSRTLEDPIDFEHPSEESAGELWKLLLN